MTSVDSVTLLQTGDHDRHLRAMRSVYAARRRHLVHELRRTSSGAVTAGVDGGLHVLVGLSAGFDEDRIVTTLRADAASRSVALIG